MSTRAKTSLLFFITIILIAVAGLGIYIYTNDDDTPDSYVVTFNASGTNLDDTTATINADGTITLPTPTRDGYEFDGWYLGDTLWTDESKATDNITLTAKWTPHKHNITFVVNNVSTTIEADYDSIPQYTGDLSKPSSDYYTYVFSNWLPAISPVKGDITYTAVFTAVKAKFSIILNTNMADAGIETGAGEYEYLSTASISTTPCVGYRFDGWYFEDFLYTTDYSFEISNINEHQTYEARYSTIDYTIEYFTVDDIPHSNITSYTVLDNNITLNDISKYGYTFNGWYTLPNGQGEKISIIDTSSPQDYELYAHFTITSYTITYNLDDGEMTGNPTTYTIETPTFTLSNPTKLSHDFLGWTGTDIDTMTMSVTITQGSIGDRVYTANYYKYNSYIVSLDSNYPMAGSLSGNGTYREDSVVSISATTNTGYTFDGWYIDNNLYSSDSYTTISVIDNNISIIAKYSLINYTITYLNDDGCTNNNITSYTVLDGTINLSLIVKTGYIFLGWYPNASGNYGRISTIDCSNPQDYTLYACFSTCTYTITYNLDGGSLSSTNPDRYNIETDTFTLVNPTKVDYEFLGWSGTGLSDNTMVVTISKGSTGNRTYTAMWRPLISTITFKTGSTTLDDITISAKPATSITEPSVSPADYNMTGYTLDGWYLDQTLTTKYTFDTMPENNITLYGEWNYFLDEGFYPYLEEFSQASTTNKIYIGSFDELVAFVDYISFNYITEAYQFEITYSSNAKNEVSTAISESTYPRNSNMVYSANYIYLTDCYRDEEGSLVADPQKANIHSQQDYVFTTPYINTRNDSNTAFNIDTVSKELTVFTSNQLIYALEKGLKPICVTGSPAERIYKKATIVLNDICDDSMTDFEKIKAIYDWMIFNVQYDHYAVDNYINEWHKYDAWFAEGVFINGVAVCDGIAKALLVLSKMENIPTVRAVSTNHAWNKVYIDGKWYGIDATHGDVTMGDSGKNYMTYNNFLFTDSFKLSQGQNDYQYDELVANTVFNYYDFVSYTYKGSTFDFEVSSQSEFVALLNYVSTFNTTSTNYSFEFTIDSDYNISFSTLMQNYAGLSSLRYSSMVYSPLDYSTGQTVYLIIVTP